jgi:hypothetical protein
MLFPADEIVLAAAESEVMAATWMPSVIVA